MPRPTSAMGIRTMPAFAPGSRPPTSTRVPANIASIPRRTTRRGEARGANFGTASAVRSRVSDSGRRRRPVCRALSSSTTDKKSGMVKKIPDWIRNWKKKVTSPPVICRHGRWSSPVPITGAGPSGNAGVSVSCGAANSCAAALSGGAFPIFDGAAWTGSGVVDSDGTPTSLSCPTSRFCVAVDNAGEVLTYNGSWSAPRTVDSGGDLSSVSCTSPSFCLAVSADTPGTAYRFAGERWSTVAVPDPSTPHGGSEPDVLSWISGATPTYALALDHYGEAFIWSGHGWRSEE